MAWSDPTGMLVKGTDALIEASAEPFLNVRTKDTNTFEGKTDYFLSSNVSASDPLALGFAPDIDFASDYRLFEGEGFVEVLTSVVGDQYPAIESFISDEADNSVFIGVQGDEGLIFNDYGKGDKNLISSNIRINMDSNGNFTSVIDLNSDDKTEYSISDWNQKFEKIDAAKNESSSN